jgi:hypothetical protein
MIGVPGILISCSFSAQPTGGRCFANDPGLAAIVGVVEMIMMLLADIASSDSFRELIAVDTWSAYWHWLDISS